MIQIANMIHSGNQLWDYLTWGFSLPLFQKPDMSLTLSLFSPHLFQTCGKLYITVGVLPTLSPTIQLNS